MNIHILGICGTFMGGLAILARSLGHRISGSDENIYPPMSEQLAQAGITLFNGYDPENLTDDLDIVIIGNAISRGNAVVEYILENRLKYTSGPQWLYENLLCNKHVLAVSGTHGKTTTTAMLTWILEYAGKQPGFLVGGIAENFACSARFTESDYFVIEADEYDTAFFDKRSKFIHYHPQTLIINNLEYDHADIFADIAAIRREFHHMIRIMPRSATILYHAQDVEIARTLAMGCWSQLEAFAGNDSKWQLTHLKPDYTRFKVMCEGRLMGQVDWTLIGQFNAENALAAVAAAASVGVSIEDACRALTTFKSVKRRLELLDTVDGISVYDDFAHHPTEILATLQALRSKVDNQRIIVIFEPRSNTMKQGVHKDTLGTALREADYSLIYHPPGLSWDPDISLSELGSKYLVKKDIDSIIDAVSDFAHTDDHIVIMSNGGFEGIHKRLIDQLRQE